MSRCPILKRLGCKDEDHQPWIAIRSVFLPIVSSYLSPKKTHIFEPTQARTTFVRLFLSWSACFVTASLCCFSKGSFILSALLEAFQSRSISSLAVGNSTSIISFPSSLFTFLAPPRFFTAPLSPLVPHVTSCKLHMAYIMRMLT